MSFVVILNFCVNSLNSTFSTYVLFFIASNCCFIFWTSISSSIFSKAFFFASNIFFALFIFASKYSTSPFWSSYSSCFSIIFCSFFISLAFFISSIISSFAVSEISLFSISFFIFFRKLSSVWYPLFSSSFDAYIQLVFLVFSILYNVPISSKSIVDTHLFIIVGNNSTWRFKITKNLPLSLSIYLSIFSQFTVDLSFSSSPIKKSTYSVYLSVILSISFFT